MAGILIVVAFLLALGFIKAVVIVPNKSAYVLERLGRYHRTLFAGFHMITPIVRCLKLPGFAAAAGKDFAETIRCVAELGFAARRPHIIRGCDRPEHGSTGRIFGVKVLSCD